jgi:hypothetical protein
MASLSPSRSTSASLMAASMAWPFRRIELVAVLGQRFLDHVHHAVGLVAGIDQFVHLLVFFGVQLGVLHHA